MKHGIALIAFTERGTALAKKLSAELGGSLRGEAGFESGSLAAWTKENFASREALVFVGAAGIAVRAVAPYVSCKAEDPAVICVDETGHWAVPLLSGHIGGANALARRIAAITGGDAVITTATDLNGAFAVDLWAKKQGMHVLQPDRIRHVSGKILRGGVITVTCPWPVAGSPPERVMPGADGDVLVSFRRCNTEALQLVPQVLVLGIGCRRGTDAEALKAAFTRFCEDRQILPQAVACAASIDIKRDETGLLDFCTEMAWPLRFYTAEELRRLPGSFSSSAFVKSRVGVDNVCERAAVLASGGTLTETKYAVDGITFALALCPVHLDWRT